VLPSPDLSPINASPAFNASAKENISSFNRLASVAISVKKKNAANNENKDQTKGNLKTSPNDATNASTRRPFGVLSTRNNIPHHVSLMKKPSGNSNGGKALKVLGHLQNVDKERTKGKGSTNVKDRVREWEKEKERLREMARLEEMQRKSDDLYEKKKKERVKEKAKKVRVVNSEERENSEEKGKEEEKKTENSLEMEIDQERQLPKKDVSPAALQIVDSANGWEWDKDFSATSPVSRSNPPLNQGLSTSSHAVIVTSSNIVPQP
jgi:serine/threonine-protein kinase GIN4